MVISPVCSLLLMLSFPRSFPGSLLFRRTQPLLVRLNIRQEKPTSRTLKSLDRYRLQCHTQGYCVCMRSECAWHSVQETHFRNIAPRTTPAFGFLGFGVTFFLSYGVCVNDTGGRLCDAHAVSIVQIVISMTHSPTSSAEFSSLQRQEQVAYTHSHSR